MIGWHWTADEDWLITKHYLKNKSELRKKLPNRKWGSIKARAFHLGACKQGRYWTTLEIAMLAHAYPFLGLSVEHLLPNRSRNDIAMKASSMKLKVLKRTHRNRSAETVAAWLAENPLKRY